MFPNQSNHQTSVNGSDTLRSLPDCIASVPENSDPGLGSTAKTIA